MGFLVRDKGFWILSVGFGDCFLIYLLERDLSICSCKQTKKKKRERGAILKRR